MNIFQKALRIQNLSVEDVNDLIRAEEIEKTVRKELRKIIYKKNLEDYGIKIKKLSEEACHTRKYIDESTYKNIIIDILTSIENTETIIFRKTLYTTEELGRIYKVFESRDDLNMEELLSKYVDTIGLNFKGLSSTVKYEAATMYYLKLEVVELMSK